ncbi:MAG: hypothetical protein ACREFJ_00040 [Acetobacteraceae bacterium]
MRKYQRFRLGRTLVIGAAVASLALMLPGRANAAGVGMRPPSCAALVAWGQSINPRDTYHVAPRLAVPKAFQEPAFSAIFGAPALDWSVEDVKTARHAIDLCYQEVRKARDRAAAAALVAGARDLTRLLPKVAATLQKSARTADAATNAIAALPDSSELATGIEILLKANPASPVVNGLRHLPQAAAVPLLHLAGTLPTLSDQSRAAIFKTLAERHDKIESAMTDSAAKAIAAAPATSAGIIALLEQRQDLARIADPAAHAQLATEIDQRIARIRDGLRQARPAVWVPPECTALYRWAGEPGANQATPIGRSSVWAMLTDAHLVPLFGIPLADWTDENLALFGKLQASCRAEASALRKDQAHRTTLAAAQSALLEAAAKAAWITDSARDSQFAAARTALDDDREATADLKVAEAKIAALPDTTESLAQLNVMRTMPALDKVGEKDSAHFGDIFNAKLHAIGAHAADAAIKGLADVQVAHLGDLPKLLDYASKVEPAIPVESGRQEFVAALGRSLQQAATRLLPEFQAKLDVIPATSEGITEAHDAVAKLTGIPTQAHLPGLKPPQVAAHNRVDAIIRTMRGKACGGLLAKLGVGSAAKEPVWDGAH